MSFLARELTSGRGIGEHKEKPRPSRGAEFGQRVPFDLKRWGPPMSTSSLRHEVVRRYLVHALTGDTGRPRPPITLVGPQTNGSAAPPLSPEAPPTPRELPWEHYRRAIISAGEPVAGDEAGPYA